MGRYYSPKQKVTLWWRQDGRCGLCGVDMNDSVDPRAEYHHVLRHADGGATSIDNGVMLCKLCHEQSHNIGRFKDSVSVSHSDFAYANFSANGESIYARKIEEIKSAIRGIDGSGFDSNLFSAKKETSNKVHEIINGFKHLRMAREDKNDLFDRVNQIKKNVDDKFQQKIKDNYDKSYNLTCEAQNLAKSMDDLRKVPEALKKRQDEAKKYMLPKKEREEIRKRFQDAWDTFNERKAKSQKQHQAECKKNYEHVKRLVDAVKNKINKSADLKALRGSLKEAQAYMKGKKFSKEQREELFKSANSAFEALNKQGEENKREYERECKNNKVLTLEKLNGFYVSEESDFKEKRNHLKSVQAYMKGKKYKREDRQYIFDKINKYFEEIGKVQTKVRERKQKEWEERQRERARKQKEWEERQRERARKQKEWEERQRERARKQKEWEERQRERQRERERKERAFKERLRENISRTEDSICRMEEGIWKDKDILRQKESKLYSVPDKYKSNIRDSISRIQDRIYSKEQKLANMRDKLRDMRSKL